VVVVVVSVMVVMPMVMVVVRERVSDGQSQHGSPKGGSHSGVVVLRRRLVLHDHQGLFGLDGRVLLRRRVRLVVLLRWVLSWWVLTLWRRVLSWWRRILTLRRWILTLWRRVLSWWRRILTLRRWILTLRVLTLSLRICWWLHLSLRKLLRRRL
jgi:hypothetical protein